ncbi:MAG: hypothetical protein RRY76_05050 [Clostridia bacterium]
MKTPIEINTTEMPKHQSNYFATETLRAVERFFEIPENQAKFEVWLSKKKANCEKIS